MWVRHLGCNDTGGVDDIPNEVAFLGLADMPPPAIMSLFAQPAPVSSVTWQVRKTVSTSACNREIIPRFRLFLELPRQINLLREELESDVGGWWLVRTRAENARGGYSSQDMTIWGLHGRCVAVARQSVAIYS